MEKIKIILGEPFTGMNSGWPTRYIGFMKELSKYYRLSIFAPGSTGLLKALFPLAEVCSSTSAEARSLAFSKLGYLKSFVQPDRRAVYLPGFDYYPEFFELLKKNPGAFDISLYFGMQALTGYGDIDPVHIKACDLCDSMLRHIMARIRSDFGLKDFLSYHFEAAYIKKLYRKFLSSDVIFLTTTQRDGEDISNILPDLTVYSVPNGTTVPPLMFDEGFFRKKMDSRCIVFLGSLDYEANLNSIFYSLDNIWPVLRNKYPALRFRIVGRNPARALTEKVSKIPGVEIMPDVEEVYPFLADAIAFFAPMFGGGGIKNKFLESLSVGTPVITNGEGAIGIDLVSGKHGIITESRKGFVDAVVTMLSLPYDRYAEYGRECIALARRYSWESVGLRLHSIIEGIAR
jgi:glycosyltransferase involved in cell wall biosynthesis